MAVYPASPRPNRIPRELEKDPLHRAGFLSGHEETRPIRHKAVKRFELNYTVNKAGRDVILDFLRARRFGHERFDFVDPNNLSVTYQVRYAGDEQGFDRLVEGPSGELYEFDVVLVEAF